MAPMVGVGGPVIYSVLFLNPRNADRRWTANESFFSFFILHVCPMTGHMLHLIISTLLYIKHSALTIEVAPHHLLSQYNFSSIDNNTPHQDSFSKMIIQTIRSILVLVGAFIVVFMPGVWLCPRWVLLRFLLLFLGYHSY